MYVIRRGWRVAEPGDTRLVATIVAEIGKDYEESGGREPTRVYFNGGTTPGEMGVVFMEWTAERLESPYRAGNVLPEDPRGLRARVRELTTESWIDFWEVMTPDKAVALEF
jgi:hypothetical protein